MRIIIDGNGRIDRQAMAVERLKTIDMTPAGGGDAHGSTGSTRRSTCAAPSKPPSTPTRGRSCPAMRDDGHEDRNEEAMGRAAASAGARYGSLEPTSKAFDRLMQEHKKERETKGARP